MSVKQLIMRSVANINSFANTFKFQKLYRVSDEELAVAHGDATGNEPNEVGKETADLEYADMIPEFRRDWEPQLAEQTMPAGIIRCSCLIAAIFSIFSFFWNIFPDNNMGDGVITRMCSSFINLFFGAIHIYLLVVFSMPSLHRFCVEYIGVLCSIHSLLIMISLILFQIVAEIERSIDIQTEGYLRVVIVYSGSFPWRSCGDGQNLELHIVQSWSVINSSIGSSTAIGCDNAVLSGGFCCGYILLSFLPYIYKLNLYYAAGATICTTLFINFALLLTGTKIWPMASLAGLQLITGLISMKFCRDHTIAARNAFALAKGMRRAAEQNRNLLYTLIPHNVVEHLATHTSGNEMPGADIADCTVMFCSIEPQELLRSSFSTEVFDLMNDVFSDFDMAVHRSGMFKYQHVGEWYIVACPRAAKAFDPVEQAAPYPTEYTVSMAQLADELQTIARRYTVSEAPLWLRVGINRGPIAGAVIGRHRAFYTLYGDTINTAARMCKYAGVAVHCTATFRDAVEAAGVDFLRCESRGEREVKGKGRMETFELHVDSDMAERARFGGQDGAGGARAANARAAWRSKLRPAATKSVASRWTFARPSITAFSLRLWSSNVHGIDKIREALKLAGSAAAQRTEEGPSGVGRVRATMTDPALERLFLASAAGALCRRLGGGLLLRIVAVICQWHMVVQPEFDYDFSALGRPDLDKAKSAARGILAAHLVAAAALTVAGFGLCAVRRTGWAQALFGASKAAHVVASSAAARWLPAAWGWLVCFAVQVACLDGLLCALPFLVTLCFNVSLFVILVAMVSTLPVHAMGAVAYAVLFTLLLCIGSALLSRTADVEERRRWLLGFRFRAELRKLRRMLFDLLPAKIAGRMLEAGGRIPCEPCVAVVLQLDICRFTELSQTMAPMEVARMLHEVFSAFDAAVLERGLFKVRFTCEAAYH